MTRSCLMPVQCCCTCCRARMRHGHQRVLATPTSPAGPCHTGSLHSSIYTFHTTPSPHMRTNINHHVTITAAPSPLLPAGEASPSSGGYLTSNFLLNCINWLVVLFIVLLLAAFTVWGAFSFALDKGAAASFTFAGQAQSTIKEGVALAEQFLTFYDSFSGNLKATLQSNPAGAQLGELRWLGETM